MISLMPILFFIVVFATLVVIRSAFRLLSSLLSPNPERLIMSNWELFSLGLSISYILTYIIKL